MRLIDADELKRRILEERDKIPLTIVERYSFGVGTPNRHGQSMRGGIRKALRCMEETPTLEMKPAARGHWIVKRFGGDARCSVCGCSFSDSYDADSHDRFCRHCGAEMDSLVLENKK